MREMMEDTAGDTCGLRITSRVAMGWVNGACRDLEYTLAYLQAQLSRPLHQDH